MTLSAPIPQPRPRPRALDKTKRTAEVAKQDREENAKAKMRSGRKCECWILLTSHQVEPRHWYLYERRCLNNSMPGVHHLIYGSGRRNVGKSILAAHKLDVCEKCHNEIQQHILVPVPGCDRERADSVRYERRR